MEAASTLGQSLGATQGRDGRSLASAACPRRSRPMPLSSGRHARQPSSRWRRSAPCICGAWHRAGPGGAGFRWLGWRKRQGGLDDRDRGRTGPTGGGASL